jgi:heat shock protein HtpX
MSDALEPVLVYTRVAANVRTTRLLVALFALILLPVISAATSMTMPIISVVSVFVASGVIGPEAFMQRMLAMDAELQAVRPRDGFIGLLDLPSSILWLTGGLLTVALVTVAIGFAVAAAFLVSRYGSRMLLRAAHARRVDAGEEPELVRVVENLCIGAGLPMPHLHIVESLSPNAFATGRDPQHASLVVTRGLLTLVDRRELQAVIAHELSHIGNHDTRLTTLLAAMVGTMSLPWKLCLAPLRYAFGVNPAAGALFSFFALVCGSTLLAALKGGVSYLMSEEVSAELPPFMWWWAMHALFAPVYALFVAPVAALVIRQAVSRQREFLADADAVRLTRDPEGLALALAKIGAADGQPLRVGEGTVHLYIVDPRGSRSLLHQVFPSHPRIEHRIALLAKMGSGISERSLEAAIAAGRRMRLAAAVVAQQTSVAAESRRQEAPSTAGDVPAGTPRPVTSVKQPAIRPSRVLVPLYERPDGWSTVLAQLDEDAVLTAVGKEGAFVRVVTADKISGYVSALAPLVALRRVGDRREGPYRS